MPLPASIPPTHSHSHSDTTFSDHQLPPPSHTSNESVSSTPSFSRNLRSSLSASSMGQVVSRPPVNTAFPSSSTPPCLGGSSSVTGSRFKRAFGRRKKSDIVLPSSITSPPTSVNVKTSSSSNDSLYGTVHSAPARQHGAKQLTLQLASHVFSRKQSGSVPDSPATSPPPLPPKHSAPHPTPQHSPSSDNVDNRVSVLTTSSSSIAPALDYIRHADASTEPEDVKKDAETFEPKDIRRKSDSTLSHHTIRPVLGGKTPRPVSMAESFQSNHTIVPVNKRLSALLTDAEYATPEEPERVDGFRNPSGRSISPDSQGSPTVSLKARDRRSHSLNLGSPFSLMSSLPTVAQASVSLDVIPPSVSRSVPEESTEPTGTSPLMLKSVIPLNASASHATQSSPAAERTLPEIPQTQPRPPLVPSTNTSFPAFRQTAISMTSGLVPAAGLARRAVEKMGRVWGSKNPPLNPSVSSPNALPSSPIGIVYRTSSGHSEPASRRKNRHIPQTPSISSTRSSISDQEGPQLGRCLRGPINSPSTGAGMGGLVFGRDLKACVKDTALDTIGNSPRGCGSTASSDDTAVGRKGHWASLEERHLPALIVRCTQHILTWGVQEQGLFRVSGRSSHIVKLRAEFDTGADFDIMQSSPGDLDPHAVASVFKAYLRELPEPILTNDLLPFFEAAMASERSAMHVPDVLSSARVGMRKPPSLSTLATPSFTGVPLSDSLRNVLSSLIARLPQENRDLLLTVTEVVKLTAQRSHETKMPLSNLLLVLCPSLNMNPTLLQALCECEGIWDGWETSVATLGISSTDPQVVGQVTGDNPAAAPTDATSLADEKQRLVRPLPKVPVDDAVLPLASTDPATTHHSNYPLASAPSSLICAEQSRTSPSFTSDDGLSLISRSGRPTTPNSMNVKLTNPYSPPSLSSSAESLSVPSLSSASPSQSAKNLQLTDDLTTPLSSTLTHSPIIAEPIPLPLTPSNTTLQPQFQFPSAGENLRKSPLIHKKSFSSSISGEIRAGPIGSRAKRMKKPSLHLLFSGRSGSPASTKSIHGNNTSTPHEASSSSPSESSPAISMVTAPQSSRFSYLPVLDTPIDGSSLSLTLGIQDQETQSDLTPPETSSTLQATDTEAEQLTTKKYFPQLDLPLPDGNERGETWAQSVLLAAGESRW